MTSFKNKWMILFIVGMSSLTIFCSLFTSNNDIKVRDNHNTESKIDM